MKLHLFIVMLIITPGLFISCNNKKQEIKQENNDSINMDHLIMSILYHQKASEINALYYQTFNLSKTLLDNDLKDKTITAKRAIILDIDETVLDNSPFEAKCVLNHSTYPKCWDEWILKASAKAFPGAADFLNYAVSKNVEIFYISNRKEHLKTATIENLKKENCPFADEKHVICREKDNSKQARRNVIEKEYHVALYFGDNLADFSSAYDNKSLPERAKATDSLKEEFGKRFIVLPNAMYGDWENAIFNNEKLNPQQQQEKRLEALVGFDCSK